MLDPTLPADGHIIKNLRIGKQLSQKALAEKAGCSHRTVQNAEAGNHVKQFLLEYISKALEVGLNTIIVNNPEPIEKQPHQHFVTSQHVTLKRHTTEQLRQYASQVDYIPSGQVHQIEIYLSVEESTDFLAGVLLGLGIALAPDATDRLSLLKLQAVLARRVVSS